MERKDWIHWEIEAFPKEEDTITHVCPSPHENFAAVVCQKMVKIIDLNQKIVTSQFPHNSDISSLAFTSDESKLITGLVSGISVTWDIQEKKWEKESRAKFTSAIQEIVTPQNNPALFATLQSSESSEKAKTVMLHTIDGSQAFKSKISNPKACFSSDGNLFVFTKKNDNNDCSILTKIDLAADETDDLLVAPISEVSCMQFSPDDTTLVILGAKNKRITLYKFGQCISTISYDTFDENNSYSYLESAKKYSPGAITFNQDGTHFAVTAYNICSLYSFPAGGQLYSNPIFKEKPTVSRIFFVSDDQFMVNNNHGAHTFELRNLITKTSKEIQPLRCIESYRPLYYFPNHHTIITFGDNIIFGAVLHPSIIGIEHEDVSHISNESWNKKLLYCLTGLVAGGGLGYGASKKLGLDEDPKLHYATVGLTAVGGALFGNFLAEKK